MAAYLTIGVMLLVMYLGLLGFVHRATHGSVGYLAGLALVVMSIPFVGYAAFTLLPPIVNNLVPSTPIR